MIGSRRPTRPLGAAAIAALLCLLCLAAGCGTPGSARSGAPKTASSAPGGGTGGTAGTGGQGTARVLYAGSLVNVMERDVGPAFAAATGDRYRGYGAGSAQVANEIKGGIRPGDLFISADPSVNATLEGARGGHFVSWYASFARSPLVLGYNPRSRFAAQLKSRPWYDVASEPGFRLGRTDPKLDPKGMLTARAIKETAAEQHLPVLAGRILRNSAVFPEEELAGRLQAGQLDAGFFYAVETSDLGVPSVSLRPIDLGATYTLTVLDKAPDRIAGVAFAAYLLGPHGRAILRHHGFTVTKPALHGPAAAVPARLRPLVGAGG